MKKIFLKEHGRLSEKLELMNERKWYYIFYSKGSFRKAQYILKNDAEEAQKAFEEFFNDCHVSDGIRADVNNYLKSAQEEHSSWQEFMNFFVGMLSMNIMVGVTFLLCIFGGYSLGASFDQKLERFPLFTIIGVLFGMGAGGFAGYLLIYKQTSQSKIKKEKQKEKVDAKTWPVIEADVKAVRKAIRAFSEKLPKGVFRTILVKEDHSIDFEQLAPFMGGIPSKKFYMSKETYDIFEEHQKDLAPTIDKIQKAVDQYVKEHKQFPTLPYDPLNRVNYYLLLQENTLDAKPDIELYITNYDGLVTHIKPTKKSTGY